MLIVFIKSIITFFLVFFVVKLMGKRTIGEMQPFELVITLIIAEVACIPMNDPAIQLYAGIVPVITLAFLQILFSYLSRKFVPIRKWVSGTSVIVVDKNGINYENLSKLNMNVNDLISSLRAAGHVDITNIQYAIIETSGKISVVQKEDKADLYLPIPLIINGKWEDDNVNEYKVEKVNILKLINDGGIDTINDVVYCDLREDGTLFVSVKQGADFSAKLQLKEQI